MGLDAEEGLAHDDKHRDVEDEIGGQIMEVQPIVEHEPANKWVEGKSQPTDEMGKEYNPFVGSGVGTICPAPGSRCAISAARYPASRSFVMSSSVTEEAIHLPPAPDMFGMALRRKGELGRWSSSA